MTLDPPAEPVDRYLRRIDLDCRVGDDGTAAGLNGSGDPVADEPPRSVDPAAVVGDDRLAALGRLQRAHLRSVPFETLSIAGLPDGSDDEYDGDERAEPPVVLELPRLYDEVVRRERGGFCFELNGAFAWLLWAVGFDVDRVAGMVLSDRPSPANHHAAVVALDRRYLVDVGTGVPAPRRPVPVDGDPVTDRRGVAWRVVPADRPDSEYRLEYRDPADDGGDADDDAGDRDPGDDRPENDRPEDGDRGWTVRYVFDDRPRRLSYFRATCSYLATAPESPFTGDPVVIERTRDGHRTLSSEGLTVVDGEDRTERAVSPADWPVVLDERFDLAID